MVILIVDDEYFARKAVVQMILDWEPTLTVLEAEDGRQAWDIVEVVLPHAVLTDICMPKWDGNQLTARIADKYPAICNVIISGYDDFKYAQKAIASGVQQYLLKPVDRHELVSLLEKIKEQVHAAAALNKEQSLSAALFAQRELSLAEVGLEAANIYAVAVLQTEHYDEHSLRRQVSDSCSEHSVESVCVCDPQHANMCVVLLCCTNSSSCVTAEKCHPFYTVMHDVAVRYQCATGRAIYAGVSSVQTDASRLPVALKEAKHALLRRLINGRNHLHLYDEAHDYARCSSELLDQRMLPLYNKILTNQVNEAQCIIRSLFDLIVSDEMSIYAVNDTCSKLVALLNAIAEAAYIKNGEAGSYLEKVDLYRFFTMDQLVAFFTQYAADLSARLEAGTAKMGMVELMQQYIEQHYRQDIVLEDLAKNVFYTDPSYLSRLFKKKTGTSFSKFLTSVRMHKARKMMENGSDLAVADIAEAVGFNDCSYFIQMYKKFFGATPGRHKKTMDINSGQ
ncbi:helix-turn-helix domain-containing protein [Paenibacillus xerothermodurans]|uniref:Response regulator n=1 Tax=Paenibacillus xerothermodurans TaxID=1977292 RepID=A0A2W1P3J7_PAEXE|nr:helix-turn-helix domain-containing protein [Paenibacillus xerothermodurans]PZE22282.1 response regulator [Paenibacillus xerothermodurans]